MKLAAQREALFIPHYTCDLEAFALYAASGTHCSEVFTSLNKWVRHEA